MARHLIASDKTIQATLRIPNQQIKAMREAKRNGLAVQAPAMHRLGDGDGLYLLICIKGVTHAWRFDYAFRGLDKTLSLGVYPKVSLADARRKADEFRGLVAAGVDPSVQRKLASAEIARELEHRAMLKAGKPLPDTFEEIARRWSRDQHADKVSPGHAERTLIRLKQNIFPWLGARPIATIAATDVLACLRRIEAKGNLETAQRTQAACSQVFRYAVAEGKRDRDPTVDLRDALRTPTKKKHAAITKPEALKNLLLAMDGYKGKLATRVALQLSALVFQRPGEVRHMEWAQLDFDQRLWTVPASLMKRTIDGKKNGDPHLVPLSDQTMRLLRELQPLTGAGRFVFPGARTNDKPISENTVIAALQSLGYDSDVMTAHGFRATARTMLAEILGEDAAVIEAQLAHKTTDPNGDSYNRAQWMLRRHDMMQDWANYLDGVRLGVLRPPKQQPKTAEGSAAEILDHNLRVMNEAMRATKSIA